MNRTVTEELIREDQFNLLLLNYLESTETGQTPDREALLRQHPEFRDDLRTFFSGQDEVTRLAAPLREAAECSARAESFCYDTGGESVAVSAGAERFRAVNGRSEIGQIGDFRILRVVGCGGMGVVYESEQVSLGRRVALKILPFAAAIDPRKLQRFKNEALAAAQLKHPNIVPVHAVGCERGVHYYAMEFVDGQSLSSLIQDRRRCRDSGGMLTPLLFYSEADATNADCSDSGRSTIQTNREVLPASQGSDERCCGREPWNWVAQIGIQAASALEFAHQTGIVHRDIKPGNLLLDPSGRLWVTDFGLAQVVGCESGLTMTGEILGTLRYSSPEQSRALQGIVDHRSDIYSLGATLYELLTLRPLFDAADRNQLVRQIANETPIAPRALDSGIPIALETIVLKTLRKDPAERYATAREFADDLQRFLTGQPIVARRPTPAERIRNWGRRKPGLVLAVMAGLLLVSIGSTISAALIRREQERTSQAHQNAEAAYRRERQRAGEAEIRFQLARRSVDEMIRVSEAELDIPGMGRLRRTLLASALAYYQEFIQQRQDDPDSQVELKETAKRVEGILAELAVLHAASQFHLLNRRAVLEDLRVTKEQDVRIEDLTGRMWRSWTDSYRGLVTVSPEERRRQALEQARLNEADVNDILTPGQRNRLRQISLQMQGPGALLEPEVVRSLQLTATQRESIRVIEEETQFQTMRRRSSRSRRTDSEAGAMESGAPGGVQNANERVRAVLTHQQCQLWDQIVGEAFVNQPAQFNDSFGLSTLDNCSDPPADVKNSGTDSGSPR